MYTSSSSLWIPVCVALIKRGEWNINNANNSQTSLHACKSNVSKRELFFSEKTVFSSKKHRQRIPETQIVLHSSEDTPSLCHHHRDHQWERSSPRKYWLIVFCLSLFFRENKLLLSQDNRKNQDTTAWINGWICSLNITSGVCTCIVCLAIQPSLCESHASAYVCVDSNDDATTTSWQSRHVIHAIITIVIRNDDATLFLYRLCIKETLVIRTRSIILETPTVALDMKTWKEMIMTTTIIRRQI